MVSLAQDDGLYDWPMSDSAYESSRMMHPVNLRNLTKLSLQTLFPDSKDSKVAHRSCLLVGDMEAGKTTLLNHFARYALEKYGRSRVNLIPVNSIREAFDFINKQLIQLILIDDAIAQANSRTSGKNAEDVADYFRIRHIFEEVSGLTTGLVATVYSTQRYMSLDITFRNSDVVIFKSCPSDPTDRKKVRDQIGQAPYDYLRYLTSRIKLFNDDEIKSTSIVHLPSIELTGTFKFPYSSPILQFPSEDGTALKFRIFPFDAMAELAKLEKSKEWKQPVSVYRAVRFDDRTQAELASTLSESGKPIAQSQISGMIRKVSGSLAETAGKSYETWKGKQLESRGYRVNQMGGKGQPDIVAWNPKGLKFIISCKVFDSDRSYSLPVAQFAPEVREAAKSKAILMVSSYNLADDSEVDTILDAKNLKDSVKLRDRRQRQ